MGERTFKATMRISLLLACILFLTVRADVDAHASGAEGSVPSASGEESNDQDVVTTPPEAPPVDELVSSDGAAVQPDTETNAETNTEAKRENPDSDVDVFDDEASLPEANEEYEAPEPMVYVLTVKGRGFGTEQSRVAVRVNNVLVMYTVLHSATAVSFVVPDALVEDEAARDSSSVEIDVGGEVLLKSVPLLALLPAMKRVPLTEFLHPTPEPSRSRDETKPAGNNEESGGVLEGGESIESEGPGPTGTGPTGTGPAGARPPGTEQGSSQREKDDVEEDSMSAEEKAWLSSLREALRDLKAKGTKESSKNVQDILEKGIEKKWPRAYHHLGSLHLAGDTPGFERDFDKAVPLLRRASGAGYAESQATMGLLYASGLADPQVEKDMGRAILLWTVAAEAGSLYAKTALAYRFYTGVDVPEDCERAAGYYEYVSREVVYASRRRSRGGGGSEEEREGMAQIRPPTPRAIQMADRKRLEENMEPRARGEDNEVIQYYKHTAERGDAPSQVMMGNLYYYGGANMPQDPALARSLFERAARNGRADAHAHLGFMDLHARRNVSAVEHLRKAADKSDKLGLHGMGFVTLHGIGVAKDEEQAAEFFRKAAEAEHPEAMFNLGLMYSKGIGVEASPEQAFRYYQEAARFGHLESSFNVGMMRLLGTPPAKQECNLAIAKYLKDVAQQGPWNAVLSKALRSYEKGDYGNALFRYMEAAHAGIELAQYNAAFMLEHDKVYNRGAVLEGTSRNLVFGQASGGSSSDVSQTDTDAAPQTPKRSTRKGGGMEWNRRTCVAEALDLYQMSSSQGYSPSMVRLGDLAYGEGKDLVRATHAYEKAARMRNAEAAFNLGWMHAVGYVSKPDANLAKRYFDQAKDMDSKAMLPATLAVYMLRYHSTFLDILDRWRKWRGEVDVRDESSASVDNEDVSESEMRIAEASPHVDKELWDRYGDVAVLTVLFGVLGIIVNARQRRMVQAVEGEDEELLPGENEVDEMEVDRADGDNGNDVHEGDVARRENNLHRRVVQR